MNKRKTRAFNRARYICLVVLGLLCLGNIYAKELTKSVNEVLQSTQISGKVIDELGEPLAGVTVKVKNSSQATMTNVDGTFRISGINTNATLEFTYIGFIKQDVTLGGKTSVEVKLMEDTKQLDEVVVVGYGTMKRTDVATAISSVKPEDFNTGGGRDVKSLLEGQVAGLTVTRTGGSDPNSNTAIQMRGVVSITGAIAPLIIIDGIPGGNIDLLKSEDIESMDILKDGSAAAIYGSRATGGVILITTKKGKAGKTQVEYSTFISRYYEAKKPQFLSSSQYRQLRLELNNPSYMTDIGGSTDWYGELIDKDNISYSHNLAISGGTESTNYRASLYYNDYNGIAKQNQRQQYGGRISLTAKGFDDMLTFQSNMSANYGYMNKLGNGLWETALKTNPTTPIYDEDGSYYFQQTIENPVERLNMQKIKRDQQTTSLDAKITLEPLKDLRFAISGGVTRNSYIDNSYYFKDSWISKKNYNGGGYAAKKTWQEISGFAEPTVSFQKTFAESHKLDAVAGYSYQMIIDEEFEAKNNGFLNDELGENNLGSGSGLQTITGKKDEMTSNKEQETLIAFFGRINYVFQNRYIAQVSLRREGSSKFGANNKWANFPSVSLGWNVTNEGFMKDILALSNLKLRIGYGETGNSGVGRYKSKSTIGTGGFYLRPDGTWAQTYGPNKNPNPDLKWETKKEWNIGVDFGIIGNRITGALDMYKRNAVDLLIEGVDVSIPSNIHSTMTMNVGEIESKGIELTLNTMPIANNNFSWKANFMFSHLFSNNLIKYKGGTSFKDGGDQGNIEGYGALGNAVRIYEGDPVGNFYGAKFAGFDDTGNWLFYNRKGDIVSVNDFSKENDSQSIGNGVPKYYLSQVNHFNYKNFDFTLSFRGRFDYDILNRTKMTYGNRKTLQAGDNVLNNIMTDGVDATYAYSDYYLESGNHIKLDNVTIGYTFRKSNPKIPTFRVYATGRDLLTITGYDGYDPEMNDTGLAPSLESRDRSPITRMFLLGLNVNF